ncbi:MAG TPA: hypothetical protein VEB86_00975 [Chryseosolibacter sp.]|nr:hypothetical protein [Chryseosolibacter sp.]
MKAVLVILFLVVTAYSYAQKAGDILVGTQVDLIKSDYDTYFQKAQAGLEFNYFFSGEFSGTAGLEFWTREGVSGVVGARWYPSEEAYVRLRGLLGNFGDVSIGGGWAKPMTEHLRFESMADFYFAGNFSIRIGLAYLISK